MIDLENKKERNKLIDDFFNKGLECNIKEVYQAVVNTVADLEYANDEKSDEIERLNNIINELNCGIKELNDMFYETFRISQNGYYSISEWELKEFTDKLQELEGSESNE